VREAEPGTKDPSSNTPATINLLLQHQQHHNNHHHFTHPSLLPSRLPQFNLPPFPTPFPTPFPSILNASPVINYTTLTLLSFLFSVYTFLNTNREICGFILVNFAKRISQQLHIWRRESEILFPFGCMEL
jgi:hypothetical protein